MSFKPATQSLITVASAAAVWIALAMPVSAQMAPVVDSPRARETLARYQEATQAAILCQNRELNLDQESRIAEMTSRATHSEYLTGSLLSTVQTSRGMMRMRIASLGCRDPLVMDRLAFFDSTIAPGLR